MAVASEHNILADLAVTVASLYSAVKLHDEQIRHLQDMVFYSLEDIDLRRADSDRPKLDRLQASASSTQSLACLWRLIVKTLPG
jgi:hypothetical protein